MRPRFWLAVLGFLLLVYVSAAGVGPIPQLGPLLEPVRGVWAVAAKARLPAQATAAIPGLGDSVLVLYDRRGVPHIFALTEEDATRALGFVVARDRLFQLELQTRATEGTLSELFGARAVELDKAQRRLGLAWSADREYAGMDSTERRWRLLDAYSQGVNAWIETLGPRDIPLEYRLLGATPWRWEPVHTLYLARRMGYTLTYSTHELWRPGIVELVGEEAAAALFPVNGPIQEPIVPGPRGQYPWFDESPLPPPAVPAGGLLGGGGVAVVGGWGGGRGAAVGVLGGGGVAAASNNWAVAPSRSATGHALLAGDPHLDLTLPSIWYEVHVMVPGALDVYGVTIPGLPTVVIGFNRHAAWSFTNVGADVLDYYREELDDLENPSRYLLDGEWRALELRVERFRDPGGRVIATDTVYHTHRGPIRFFQDTIPVSQRWTNLEAESVTDALFRAQHARSVNEYLEAMETFYPSAQNMVVADRKGNIAMRSTGRFPLRPAGTKGYEIQDGKTSASDWIGYRAIAEYPTARNPLQGYLASANQEPVDPAADSNYLGVNWPSPWRAMRINRLLRDNRTLTPDDVRRYQTDPGNERAETFVPLFLGASATVGEAGASAEARRLLAEWDRRYTPDATGAILFELAMDELEDRVWDELIPASVEGEPTPRRVATPTEAVLWRAVQDPDGAWCDDRRSQDVVETCDAILAASLRAAYESATSRYGEPGRAGWRWGRIRTANIYHLTGIRSLSQLDIPIQGGPGNLNPLSGDGTHGASWRMVVELGDEVRARTIYPGGQSGNPVSPWYDDRIPRWSRGELDQAAFPRSPDELEIVAARLTLRSGS